MASSGKPKRSSAGLPLVPHVAGRLRGVVGRGECVVVGLSGGIDSVVLLDVLARLRRRLGFELRALHVNHGLSPHAAAWARFCRALCRSQNVPCRVVRVDVARGNSIERTAREARYAALRAAKADCIALAHNRDDQAETVLLQLLRGTGVKGLAAMPALRRDSAPALLRPLLEATRADIERYAKRRKLQWIDDESNTDTRYTRNWLRHELMPRIEARAPAYRETLARAARHMAAASELLDDLAGLDAGGAIENDALRVDVLRTLSPARAGNLLRFMLARAGARMPEAGRLGEALRQATGARADAGVRVDLGDCELRRHAGLVHLVPRLAGSRQRACIEWRGEPEIALPFAGGVLAMTHSDGEGLSAGKLAGAHVTLKSRAGGERLQTDPRRPRRTVKNLLQEARIAPWERERVPFIYCDEVLACVPGVAIDWRFRAAQGEPSVLPVWRSRLGAERSI